MEKLVWFTFCCVFLAFSKSILQPLEVGKKQSVHAAHPVSIHVCSTFTIMCFQYKTERVSHGNLSAATVGHLWYQPELGRRHAQCHASLQWQLHPHLQQQPDQQPDQRSPHPGQLVTEGSCYDHFLLRTGNILGGWGGGGHCMSEILCLGTLGGEEYPMPCPQIKNDGPGYAALRQSCKRPFCSLAVICSGIERSQEQRGRERE